MTKDNKNNTLSDIRSIFSKRLQNARKICGVSQAELAARMEKLAQDMPQIYKGVSSTAIERYENGIMFPESDAIIITLAEALHTHTYDLIRPFTVEVDCSKFEFRKKARLGKKATEAIKLKIQQRIEKYVEIERIANAEMKFDIHILSDILVKDEETARQAAMKLRRIWKLGMGPLSQPILILESQGVKVIEVEENPELFDGTSNMVEGIPVLVLNKQDNSSADAKFQNNEERRRLTLFHELGHQVLNFSEEVDDKNKENLCNVFASEMLIPSQTFIHIFGSKRNMISSWELKDVQREFGISVRALMMKATQLGVVTTSRYKWFCITMNKKENSEFRQIMDATAIPTHHTSRFDRLVYRSLASEIITISKAAQLLDTTVSQVKENINFNFIF